MYILFKQHFFETSGNTANYQKVTPHSNIQVGWIRINLFVSLHGIEFWLLDFAQTVPFIFSWRCWLPFMRISCPLFIKNILSRPANHWNIFEAVRYYQIYQSLEMIIHSLWYFNIFPGLVSQETFHAVFSKFFPIGGEAFWYLQHMSDYDK